MNKIDLISEKFSISKIFLRMKEKKINNLINQYNRLESSIEDLVKYYGNKIEESIQTGNLKGAEKFYLKLYSSTEELNFEKENLVLKIRKKGYSNSLDESQWEKYYLRRLELFEKIFIKVIEDG